MVKVEPPYRRATMALGLLTALNLFNFIDRYVLPGVQPLIQREFRASDERMGALTYAFFVTYMLAAPLTGWLGDRLARKPLIIAGALLETRAGRRGRSDVQHLRAGDALRLLSGGAEEPRPEYLLSEYSGGCGV